MLNEKVLQLVTKKKKKRRRANGFSKSQLARRCRQASASVVLFCFDSSVVSLYVSSHSAMHKPLSVAPHSLNYNLSYHAY